MSNWPPILADHPLYDVRLPGRHVAAGVRYLEAYLLASKLLDEGADRVAIGPPQGGRYVSVLRKKVLP